MSKNSQAKQATTPAEALDSSEQSANPRERSGRFPISERTMLPPRSSDDSREFSLDELAGPVSAESARVFAPPAGESHRGLVSDVHALLGADPADVLDTSSIPAPGKVYERAELKIDDLSFSMDNPFAGSSLVPPAPKPFPTAKVLGSAVSLIAVAGLLFGAWSQGLLEPSREPAQGERALPQGPAVAVAPAAVVVAVAKPAAEAEDPSESFSLADVPEEIGAKAVAKPRPKTDPKALLAPAKPAAPTDAQAALAAVLAEPSTVQPVMVQEPATAEVSAPSAVPAPEVPSEELVGAVVLPETPTREQIKAGFEAVRPVLTSCAAGKVGTAKLNVTIASTGRVSYAMVDGDFQGTAEGSCIARGVRKARFPEFSRSSLKVNYPFAL